MNEGVRKSIGKLLRQLRSERAMSLVTVEELTEKLGARITRSRLSELERGDIPVPLDDVQVLCRVYGLVLADLFMEALAARPTKHFPRDWSAEDLFEEGKRMYGVGKLHEAGWAFDAAAERAEAADETMVGLARASACHCYDRMGANRLAMRRIEEALDVFEGESEASSRAIGKMAVLLAGERAEVRARVYLDASLAKLEADPSPELRAYLLDSSASALHLLGDLKSATRLSLQAARLYRRLGDFDWAGLKLAAAATYLAKQGKLEEAVRCAFDAEGLLDELTRIDTRAFVLLALGRVSRASGKIEDARRWLADSFQLAKAHGLALRARDAAESLESIAKECGDSAEHRRWRKRLRTLAGASLGGILNKADQDMWSADLGRTP